MMFDTFFRPSLYNTTTNSGREEGKTVPLLSSGFFWGKETAGEGSCIPKKRGSFLFFFFLAVGESFPEMEHYSFWWEEVVEMVIQGERRLKGWDLAPKHPPHVNWERFPRRTVPCWTRKGGGRSRLDTDGEGGGCRETRSHQRSPF